MDKYAALTGKGVEAYVAALNEIGWFKLSQNFKRETESRLKEIQEPRLLQSGLSHLYFDAEGFESATAYESLLEEILEILDLEETEYQVDEDDDIISVQLKIGENKYEYEINIAEHEDWLDQNFIQEFINSVVAKEKLTSHFFCLPPADQTIEFVFVPETMYEAAVAKGLIPEEMEYFMVEDEEA